MKKVITGIAILMLATLAYSRDAAQSGKHYDKAIELGSAGDFPAAVTELATALKEDPYNDAAHGAMVIAGDVTNGTISVEAGKAMFDGCAKANKKQLDGGIAAFKKAIELAPKYSAAYSNLGNVYLGKNMTSAAMGAFRKALEVNPNDADAHGNIGLDWANKGRWDKAIAEFQKSIDLKPSPRKQSTALCNMGLAYEQKGMLDKAIDLYKKAITVDPTDAEGFYSLATSYYYKHDYAKAIGYCDKARALGRDIHPNFEAALRPHRKK